MLLFQCKKVQMWFASAEIKGLFFFFVTLLHTASNTLDALYMRHFCYCFDHLILLLKTTRLLLLISPNK